ncbi:MAG: hypothetical protein NTZ68_03865 [Candidatus Dependentiae bacterium]|nr:hypothetical protein [Candidatus Dependentiae bacterium]
MKKILFSTLTLMSALSFGMATKINVAAPVAVAPVAIVPVVPAVVIKQALTLTDPTLIARLDAMKAIVEASESDLDKKVAQLEAFAESYDKFKKSSTFMSPDEIKEINTKIDETLKDIDTTIASAQEWSLLPDGPQVAKLKDIKRRLHNKAKDYTGSWEFGRTMRVYAHSFWKPALTALVAAATVYGLNKYSSAK